MTTDEARAIAADFQDRCAQMGERHGETGRLSALISVILNLCTQLDAAMTDPLIQPEPPAPPPPLEPPTLFMPGNVSES